MIVELTIAPGSTLDLPHLNRSDVRAKAEAGIAELMHERFLFLAWLPSVGASDPQGPRLRLTLADRSVGACEPPEVFALFEAGVGDRKAWHSEELEFSAVCDLSAFEMSVERFLERVIAQTRTVLDDPEATAGLQRSFLAEIALAHELAPDFAGQKLFLPVAGLKAQPESELVVRWREDRPQMVAHPGGSVNGRTQLLITAIDCGGVRVDPPPDGALPFAWHPGLVQLFASSDCSEPSVYMRVYKPRPLEIESQIVTRLDDEGEL